MEQAIVLKESLTKEEHGKVWGRHQTHLQKNALEKGELEGLSKKEKGMKAAEWLMRTAAKKYLHVTREVAAQEPLEKDKTGSQRNQFDWQELQAWPQAGSPGGMTLIPPLSTKTKTCNPTKDLWWSIEGRGRSAV